MNNLIQANHISLTIYGRSAPILYETSLGIIEGEFIVILGHNGSGKSSLIKLLSGSVHPSSGKIFFNNLDIKNISNISKAIDIITLSQKSEERLFDELTLRENIILWESRFKRDKQLTPTDICELTTRPTKFINSLDYKVYTLSGGEKQIFLFALMIAHPPKVLFLDEHTSALDPRASRQVMEVTASAVSSNKITTIMVTHKIEDAVKYGDRIIVMDEGKIILDQKKSSDFDVGNLNSLMNHTS